ncbi:hypothetical protein ACS0TY_012103 [Phlomoides rotata]
MDGNVGGGTQDVDKGKSTRGWRTWSKIEEDALVQCLTDIMNDGWKADNGFRCGFHRELEKGMWKLLIGTDIVANPHINSKIHVWKKEYGALSDLLSKSGISWNSTTNTIDVLDKTVWDAQKKIDPKVVSMRHKSWPYYESWLDIFGKDRATGEHAADPIDIVNELMRNGTEEEGETGMKIDAETKDNGQVAGDASVCKPSGSGLKTVKGKKRKGLPSEMALLVETLGEFMKSTIDSFNSLANYMVPEPEVKVARTPLNEIMKRIPGLSLQDKLKVLKSNHAGRHVIGVVLPVTSYFLTQQTSYKINGDGLGP